VAHRDFAPGEAQFEFHLGWQKQTLEIGGFAAINYGTASPASALPRVKVDLSYAGREPTQPGARRRRSGSTATVRGI
jgi:hypothetical protein